MEPYSLSDIQRGYAWLAHERYTEITALSPAFRRNDPEWNRKHDAWPMTGYVTSCAGVVEFVRSYAGERLVCYGLNPRPGILTKSDGRLRAATNADIAVVRNVALDIDLDCEATVERLAGLARLLDGATDYWRARGISSPVRASSGNGYHLLFAIPPIALAEYPGVGGQLRALRDEFVTAHEQALGDIGAVVDSTMDVARKIKVYGTSKPGSQRVSTFPTVARNDDAGMREYLLRLPATPAVAAPTRPLVPGAVLPSWFAALLDDDTTVRDLFDGTGKRSGDCSRSGYDWALVRTLVNRGYTDARELATILTLRSGSGDKGIAYVTRTVEHALNAQGPKGKNGGGV